MSNLQAAIKDLSDQNPFYEEIKRELDEQQRQFHETWRTDPPVTLPDSEDLWSRENIAYIAEQCLDQLSSEELFHYVAAGLINGGNGKDTWLFVPLLQQNHRVTVDIVIACPAIDNFHNVAVTVKQLKEPFMQEILFALAHGEKPPGW